MNTNKELRSNDSKILLENEHCHNFVKINGDSSTATNYYGQWELFGKILEIEKLENNMEFVCKLNLYINYTIKKPAKMIGIFLNVFKQNDVVNIDYYADNISINKKQLPLILKDDTLTLYIENKNVNERTYIQVEYARCNQDNIIKNMFKDNGIYSFSLPKDNIYYPKTLSQGFIEVVDDINDLGNNKWDDSIVGRIAISNSANSNSQALKIAIKNSENATFYENIQLARSCTTYYRPKDNLTIGTSVFDITLGKPIWCKSITEYEKDGTTVKTPAVWVDALGTEV